MGLSTGSQQGGASPPQRRRSSLRSFLRPRRHRPCRGAHQEAALPVVLPFAPRDQLVGPGAVVAGLVPAGEKEFLEVLPGF